MERRNFLKTAGGIGAATAIGGAGVIMMSGGASAYATGSFYGTTVYGESDDGSLDDLTVTASDIAFEYEGLQNAASEAEVTLYVEYDGDRHAIDSAVRSGLGGTTHSGLALGEDLSGSILEDNPYLDASDFESDEDGEEIEVDEGLILVLKVDVRSNRGMEAVGENQANLRVVMQNVHSDAKVGGNTGGEAVTSELIGVSPTNPEADVETEGVLTVRGRNEGDQMVFLVDLEEPWSDEEEDQANLGLGFDTNSDGLWDFQVNWSSEEGFFSENENRSDYEHVPEFNGDKDGETLVFEIEADEFDGDMFEFVANSSYGGSTHANVSAEPDKAWSSEPDGEWRSSEYFVTVELTE